MTRNGGGKNSSSISTPFDICVCLSILNPNTWHPGWRAFSGHGFSFKEMKRPRSLEFEFDRRESKRQGKPTWLDLDRPDLEPTQTYPIDKEFLQETLDSKDCQRDEICSYISHNIRHVSFHQFVNALNQTIDRLAASGALDEPFALAPIVGTMCKSGLWVMELILDRTLIGHDPKFYPALVFEPGEDSEVFQRRALERGITTLVLVDDAAYTGLQAGLYARFISPRMQRVEFVIPFSTQQAKDVILERIPVEKSRIWSLEVIPVSPLGVDGNQQRTAWYFDHKLPDSVSTFPELRHWISGCQSRKDCMLPPYKTTRSCPSHLDNRANFKRQGLASKESDRQEQLKFLKSLPNRVALHGGNIQF